MLEKTDINIFKYINFGEHLYVSTRQISLNYIFELYKYSRKKNCKVSIVLSETISLYDTLFCLSQDYSNEMFMKKFEIFDFIRKEIGKTINLYFLKTNNTFFMVSENIIFGTERLYKSHDYPTYSLIVDSVNSERLIKHFKNYLIPDAININQNILDICDLVDLALDRNNILAFINNFINEYRIPENTVQYSISLEQSIIWETLFDFQRDGVISLINILEKERGAFLCDDVGLGKTYQTLALIKYYSLFGTSALVFAPKNLVTNWEKYSKYCNSEFANDYLDMQVHKHTRLSIPNLYEEFLKKFSFTHIGLVVIDEAHFYRNSNTIGFKNLVHFLGMCNPNVKVLIISATPINNDLIDLENLVNIALIKSPNKMEIIKCIRQYRLKNTNEYKYEKVVSDLIIRRTRNDIKNNYGSKFSFPRMVRENQFMYSSDQNFETEIGKIIELNFDDGNTRLINLLLFKRLESSFIAFYNTVTAILNNRLVEIEEEGYEIEQLNFFNEKENIKILQSLLDSTSLRSQAIKKEQILLSKIADIVKRGEKVLIFSCYKDTVEYLYQSLRLKYTKIAYITGDKSVSYMGYMDREKILNMFSPNSRNCMVSNEIDVLIATDVISEGQNLQDCANIIHYDLHWNPVRQIQREGRINRIGTQNELITAITFWPTKNIDEYLNLKNRIEHKEKISEINSSEFDEIYNNLHVHEDKRQYNMTFLERFDKQLVKNIYGLQGYFHSNLICGEFLILLLKDGKFQFIIFENNSYKIVNTNIIHQLNSIFESEEIVQEKIILPDRIKKIEGRKILVLEIRRTNE